VTIEIEETRIPNLKEFWLETFLLFSSLLGLWRGGFEGEKWRQLDFFIYFK
jgi:hypothetical protein